MCEEGIIISEIREGNHLVFTLCYERYHKGLYALALKYTHNATLAEDIVQHSFMKLWEQRKQLNPYQSLGGYTYSIARNHILNHLRNSQRQQAHLVNYSSQQPLNVEPPNQEQPVVSTLMFESCLASMTPQRQQVYQLKVINGLSNKEVAEALNISVNTVKVLYSRLLNQLRQSLVNYIE